MEYSGDTREIGRRLWSAEPAVVIMASVIGRAMKLRFLNTAAETAGHEEEARGGLLVLFTEMGEVVGKGKGWPHLRN